MIGRFSDGDRKFGCLTDYAYGMRKKSVFVPFRVAKQSKFKIFFGRQIQGGLRLKMVYFSCLYLFWFDFSVFFTLTYFHLFYSLMFSLG